MPKNEFLTILRFQPILLITMPMTCSVCVHPQRQAIDAVLATGLLSLRHIAAQYGFENHSSIARHKRQHLIRTLTRAAERKEIKEEDEFLDGIRATAAAMANGIAHGQRALADGLIDAELAYRMSPAMAAQQLRAMEMLGQATGRLSQGASGGINLQLQVVMPTPVSMQPVIDISASSITSSDTPQVIDSEQDSTQEKP